MEKLNLLAICLLLFSSVDAMKQNGNNNFSNNNVSSVQRTYTLKGVSSKKFAFTQHNGRVILCAGDIIVNRERLDLKEYFRGKTSLIVDANTPENEIMRILKAIFGKEVIMIR